MARYFVNPRVSRGVARVDGIGRYWRGSIDDRGVAQGGEIFSGWCDEDATYRSVDGSDPNCSMRFQINLNLLAQLLGDTPPAGIPLVDPIEYVARHRDEPSIRGSSPRLMVQPWEPAVPGLGVELPIGPRLAQFLDDPLGVGRPLGLALPFLDPATSVSLTWFREHESRFNSFHGGFDFNADPPQPGVVRPLVDVSAAAPGTVWMLLNPSRNGGGVILRHEPEPGAVFATLYQHLHPDTVELAVGESVARGQRIGRIRRISEPTERSHLHFNVLVRGPRPVAGSPWFWFSIDPFGVYDEHVPQTGPNAPYVPRQRDGMREQIRGAERAIHWAGDPPIRAFAGELMSDLRKIASVQVRSRSSGGSEVSQMLVWLEGESDRYYLRMSRDLTRGIEHEACALLRDAYHHRKPVRLGYRFDNDRKYVSAVWAAT